MIVLISLRIITAIIKLQTNYFFIKRTLKEH
jgi:hypothetical protein